MIEPRRWKDGLMCFKPSCNRLRIPLLFVLACAWTVQVRAEPKNIIFFIGDGMGYEQV